MKRNYYIYISSFLLGLHYSFILYVNSSFLSQFWSAKTISLFYIAGSILNVILFILTPKILNKIGVRAGTTGIILLEFFIVTLLSKTTSHPLILTLFILQQGMGPLILYCIDLILEAHIESEKVTGAFRTALLASLNFALIISLLLVPHLIGVNSYARVYSVSAYVLIPMLAMIAMNLKEDVRKSRYTDIGKNFKFIVSKKEVLRILMVNMVLQLFYSIMIIFLPLLLTSRIGFGWQDVGNILVIMILPFLLFEVPIGRAIDKKMSVKEFLFLGLVIMAVACFSVGLTASKNFIFWALILFMSRIGASLVEATSETFFFKQVTERHSGIISFFRMTQSSAFIFGPAFAYIALNFTNYSGFFILLGFLCLIGTSFIPKTEPHI